ncbi:alkaline phosphatase family protein [Galbitalea soli]|uniref:Acid phosphatase n=1 Tax=Galbitalea soli TaxID=1268042 RepID=A0A7C9TP80_9MICO|nr:alkaline phosphatase family protein [Galbitalea soli]NEM90081.1 acid phosphatase [Galbitalea soli]NYJ30788.1 acid phosphatase [Galbitalea soli]
MRTRSPLLALSAVLLLAGCAAAPGPTSAPAPSAPAAATHAPSAPATPTPRTAPAPSRSHIDHIVVIVEENKAATTVLGNPDAPYLNALARAGAVATRYRAVAHPSLPNYLALTGGSTAGITSDCLPGPGCHGSGPSIAGELAAAGYRWGLFADGMPSACDRSNAGEYAVKHNPFAYYPAIESQCASSDLPLSALTGALRSTSTLPELSYVIPDLCHDMHSCPVGTGDRWLARVVPGILASPAFTQQHSLLVVTFDEDENRGGDNRVLTVLAGPAARPGARSATPASHYSLLRTIEANWSLAPMRAGDSAAAPLTVLLR